MPEQEKTGWWVVTITPVNKGLLVYLTDGQTPPSLVGRVAWNRFESIYRRTSFKRSLRRVITRAEQEAEERNGQAIAQAESKREGKGQ